MIAVTAVGSRAQEIRPPLPLGAAVALEKGIPVRRTAVARCRAECARAARRMQLAVHLRQRGRGPQRERKDQRRAAYSPTAQHRQSDTAGTGGLPQLIPGAKLFPAQLTPVQAAFFAAQSWSQLFGAAPPAVGAVEKHIKPPVCTTSLAPDEISAAKTGAAKTSVSKKTGMKK